MAANVLVIGGGGREHALSWKLAQSPKVKRVFVAPGNVGMEDGKKVTNINLNITDFKAISDWCSSNEVNLVVVGPEIPLANGLADALADAGILCFGPKKAGAQIEASKDWGKHFMDKHNIPTARWKSFTNAHEAKKFIQSAPFAAQVVKASGLAAGKGVIVAPDKDTACRAVDDILTDQKFGSAGATVVVEELLEGEEVSVLAFTDGESVRVMLPSQDHKRLLDGDKGPMTGGVGAYCPCPLLNETELHHVENVILQRTVEGLKKDGIPYVGVLYAGLMITKDGPKVLEFNCRFGDPETQVLLPLLESDLYEIMLACCSRSLNKLNLQWKTTSFSVGIVLSSGGYPESSTKGKVISGLEELSGLPDHVVFHSGTARGPTGEIVTNGGRVLIVVAFAADLQLAAAKALRAAKSVLFESVQFRRDIAHKGIARSLLTRGRLTYKASGVDIVAGDSLVRRIKESVDSTKRSGVMGSIGGFGGLFDLKAAGYIDPILVSGTDGVGTKLKIAQDCDIHSTIGIDLVAMCVNDTLAHGAEPLFFLDYFACSHLDVGVSAQVVHGVAEGCRQAGCALIGGETAEMPGLYAPGDYDVAGFAVAAVERTLQLPRTNDIRPGDLILAVPSSGLHSNGFSLVRKAQLKSGSKLSDKVPFVSSAKTLGEALLTPTKIYVKSLLRALRSGRIKALAHITGGGLTENIPRVLPTGVGVVLDATSWQIPPVFGWLAAAGGISEYEMLRTFNCGVGLILVVAPEDEDSVISHIINEPVYTIGSVQMTSGDEPRVVVKNFPEAMEPIMRPFLQSNLANLETHVKKRVGVLISGSGTNLQALIDHTLDPLKNSMAEIVLVISNKPNVEGLQRAARAGIPTQVIPHGSFKTRLDFDMAVHAVLQRAGVELVCLAGFMRVLTGEFVRKWQGRLINIHPALLPLFKGTHAHRQALAAGVRVTGCTVHFVEEDIDAGAILVQKAVPIEIGDTEETLQERVLVKEHEAFPEALELLASGSVLLDSQGKLVWHN